MLFMPSFCMTRRRQGVDRLDAGLGDQADLLGGLAIRQHADHFEFSFGELRLRCEPLAILYVFIDE